MSQPLVCLTALVTLGGLLVCEIAPSAALDPQTVLGEDGEGTSGWAVGPAKRSKRYARANRRATLVASTRPSDSSRLRPGLTIESGKSGKKLLVVRTLGRSSLPNLPVSLQDLVVAFRKTAGGPQPALPGRRRLVGVSLVRRSKPEAHKESLSIQNQKDSNERRRREIRVARYRDTRIIFHLIEDNVTGTRVMSRDAIRYLEDLIAADEITHVFVFLINRLARSTKREALQLLGLMADHRITIVTRDAIYETWNDVQRNAVYQQLFIGERESSDKSVAITDNLQALAADGYFAQGQSPWGTTKVPDGAHKQLRYRVGAQAFIRGVHEDFDRHWDGKPGCTAKFLKAVRTRRRPSWARPISSLHQALLLLINPTYEGYYVYGLYHLLRRLHVAKKRPVLPPDVVLFPKASMKIQGLPALRKKIRRRLSAIFERPVDPRGNHKCEALTLEALLEMDAIGLLELVPNRTVFVACPRPRCRRKALQMVRQDRDVSVRNGGKRFGNVWLPKYKCVVSNKPQAQHTFYVIPPRLIRRFSSGCRCMRCGTLNYFGVTRRTDTVAKAYGLHRLWRVECLRCNCAVYLVPGDWHMVFPFTRLRKDLAAMARNAPRSKDCICMNPHDCAGMCDAAAEHLRKGRPLKWVALKVGISVGRVSRIRDRNRIGNQYRLRGRNVDAHELEQEYRLGKADRAIAKTVGAPIDVVRKWRRSKGLPPHRMQRRFTYDVAKAWRLLHWGGSDAAVAKQVHASAEKIKHLRKLHGMRSAVSANKVKDRLARRRHAAGWLDARIAKEQGVARGTISKWRMRRGLLSNSPRIRARYLTGRPPKRRRAFPRRKRSRAKK